MGTFFWLKMAGMALFFTISMSAPKQDGKADQTEAAYSRTGLVGVQYTDTSYFVLYPALRNW